MSKGAEDPEISSGGSNRNDDQGYPIGGDVLAGHISDMQQLLRGDSIADQHAGQSGDDMEQEAVKRHRERYGSRKEQLLGRAAGSRLIAVIRFKPRT